MSENEIWQLLNVNVGAVTMMSKIVLPQMKNRRQGAIVNVSSGSELQPLPLMSIYAATKVSIIILLLGNSHYYITNHFYFKKQ